MNKSILISALLCTLSFSSIYAQDKNERVYNYEVLNAQGNTRNITPKPKVQGWATERVDENLGRGLVAVKSGGGVYLSWRSLKSDCAHYAFNVYRSIDGKKFTKINSRPVTKTTDFVDAKGKPGYFYQVRTLDGKKIVSASEPVKALENNYFSVNFQGNYPAQKIAVGDLDGDGNYDFVIKQPQQRTDPGSWHKSDDTFKLEAYKADGTFLWRYDLGWNIEQGVWYSPFVVADLDGDGIAEVAVKTAPTDKDYRDQAGRVVGNVPYNYNGVKGSSPYGVCPEYLSILDGRTGKELARTEWIAQDESFGDYNRNNRHQMAIAYLDGKTPSVIMMKGTYRRMAANAYQFKDGKLELQWAWDGDQENPVIRSQGAHQTVCADVDGDGRDEVILGSAVLDDNGQILWSADVGHSDKAIVADIDPDNEGLEILYANEVWHEKRGVCLVDAKTGTQLWEIGHYTGHVGNGMALDLDPSIPGLECIAQEDGGKTTVSGEKKYIMDCKGNKIGSEADVPGCTDWIWWDADNLREMPVRSTQAKPAEGQRPVYSFGLGKYKGEIVAEGFEGGIMMIADLVGDWREEFITVVNGEMRIYTTTIPASDRKTCLMQDPLYRSYVCSRSMGYNQAPTPGYNF